MSLTLKKLLICAVITVLLVTGTQPAIGQVTGQLPPEAIATQSQPPMKNVFLNVLWGALSGGFLLMGWSTLDDSIDSEERFRFSRMTNQFLVGATYGSILGLGAGVYFSIRGITFDSSRSRIALYPDYSGNPEGQHFFATSQAVKGKNALNLLHLHVKF